MSEDADLIVTEIQDKQDELDSIISLAKEEIISMKLREAIDYLQDALVIKCLIDGLKDTLAYINRNK